MHDTIVKFGVVPRKGLKIDDTDPSNIQLVIGSSRLNTFSHSIDLSMMLSYYFEKDYGIKSQFICNIGSLYNANQADNTEIRKFMEEMSLPIYALIWIAFISLGSYLILHPLKERTNNVKHTQYLSGSNMFSYWFGYFVTDMTKYLFFLLVMTPIFLYIDKENYLLVLMFIPFLMANTVYSYVYTFIFDSEQEASKYYVLINLFLVVLIPIIVVTQFFLKRGIYVSDGVTWILSEGDFFPLITMLLAIFRLDKMFFRITNDMSVPLIAPNLLSVFGFQFLFYSFIVFLCEKRVFTKLFNKIIKKPPNINEIDELLPANENNNLYYQDSNDRIGKEYTVSIQGLHKTFCTCFCFRKVRAVNNLYLNLEANEKFGLLGFNGSGKTTTFKSIANEIFFEQGTINIFGLDVTNDFDKLRMNIGYCPQENALFDYLTVEETLQFYKRLRGVNVSLDSILKQYDLKQYKHTVTTNLSGGNKRKLIFAIALMNNPKLVLLDEPSTGVDPKSRREMWKNLTKLADVQKEYNMILSTHSMEEAEVLCDTVSWLKNGNFICIGNPEKLKLQFSTGYNLHVKFNPPKEEGVYNNEYIQNTINQFSTMCKIDVNYLISLVNNNQILWSHLKQTVIVLNSLNSKLQSITLKEIKTDFSFDFNVQIIPQQQGELFAEVLTMSNEIPTISEISINVASLETVLTQL